MLHFYSPITGHFLYSTDSLIELSGIANATTVDPPPPSAGQVAMFDGVKWTVETFNQIAPQLSSGSMARNAAAEGQRQRLHLRQQIYIKNDLDALLGKTSNALAATLNLQMQIFQRLAVAQSFAEVNAAVQPALPLMQRISGMLERGELMSVQYAQGMTDDDAIIEALESMTKVARIIRDYEQAQSANVAT